MISNESNEYRLNSTFAEMKGGEHLMATSRKQKLCRGSQETIYLTGHLLIGLFDDKLAEYALSTSVRQMIVYHI